MLDQYNKIAATVCSKMQQQSKLNPIIAITSSAIELESTNELIDCANGIAKAFVALNKQVTMIDARLAGKPFAKASALKTDSDNISRLKLNPSDKKEDAVNDNAVKALFDSEGVRIIVTDTILNSSVAMFFFGASDGVILCEKKKLSRVDKIEEAIETIKNLNALPLGFVLI